MHAKTMITRVLGSCLPRLHAKRAKALLDAVVAMVLGSELTLSAIARGLPSEVCLRHRIKRVDRLLGNAALSTSRSLVYGAVAEQWLQGFKQLLIVVDWSDVTADQKWHLLRASVAVEARSVTLYEEVHPQKHLGNLRVHKRFLKQLAQMLPRGCQVIVMTDAGFRSTWFQLVAAHGWEWIGRVRNRDLVRPVNGPWQRATDFYAQATSQPRDLGCFTYVRSNPVACRLTLVKRECKSRHRLTVHGKKSKCRHSIKNARRQREPWLIASSIGLAHLSAQAIVKLYAQRMGIEQSFRDLKSTRFGMGFSNARSRGRVRLEMLMLIAHLASFVMRLIGQAAKQQQLELQFQSTNRRNRREISVMTIARRVIDGTTDWLQRLEPWRATQALAQQARHAYPC